VGSDEHWMNTYFVAKTLSERLVMSYHGKALPVCIVRPTLIGCVAGNPYPGYIGNSSGLTAIILGTLAGQTPLPPPTPVGADSPTPL
jgi:thioester reductase-like protein